MSAGDNFRIYGRKTVLDAARERIAWVFDEFPNVVVNVSGGKDSTVIFHLAMEVARAKGRLPLTVRFIDQEAEWQATIDVIRSIMEHPDVNPRWYQMPIVLFNATSTQEHWLRCWAPEDEHRWMRPREPYAITENVYGTERFAELFPATLATEYPNTPTAVLTGVRVEESPGRAAGLTGAAVIKGRTWGRVENRKLQHFAWHPLYDWSYMDVWKAIHERGWKYNRIYDHQYQWGLSVLKMRVSNVHHETSVGSLWYMQEAEPETYARLTARISGVDAATKAAPATTSPRPCRSRSPHGASTATSSWRS